MITSKAQLSFFNHPISPLRPKAKSNISSWENDSCATENQREFLLRVRGSVNLLQQRPIRADGSYWHTQTHTRTHTLCFRQKVCGQPDSIDHAWLFVKRFIGMQLKNVLQHHVCNEGELLQCIFKLVWKMHEKQENGTKIVSCSTGAS